MKEPHDYLSAKRMMDDLERQHRRTNWMMLAVGGLSVIMLASILIVMGLS